MNLFSAVKKFCKLCKKILRKTGILKKKRFVLPMPKPENVKLRFALAADPHYAKRYSGYYYYEQSLDKMRDAVEKINEVKPDFFVILGDIKDRSVPTDKEKVLTFLTDIESLVQTADCPVYHVSGNHDVDAVSKEEFLQHIKNNGEANGKTFYAYRQNGIKLIVLDADFSSDETPYCCGEFDWKDTVIPSEELQWLAAELQTDEPVIVFTHQNIDFFTGGKKDYCVKNAAAVVEMLEKEHNVLAVFQGHYHGGGYSFRNRIHYCTLLGMIEGTYPKDNSFAVADVDEENNITVYGFGNCECYQLKRK